MASTESFVDLGADFDAPADPPAPQWWPMIRRFRLPVLLIVALLVCGASMSPSPSPLRLVASAPVAAEATVMIEGPDLYVMDLKNGIRAFALAGGREIWSAATIELSSESTLTYAGGQVIVSMTDTDPSGEHTVAFDAATGRKRWTSDYGSARPIAGGVLVQAMPRPPGFNYPGTPQAGSVRLIDPQTGAPVWTYDIAVNCSVAVATSIVELCPNSSQLALISLADGRPTSVRTVPLGDAAVNFLLPIQDQLSVPQLDVAGDTVLVAHADTSRPVLDAYAMSDLHGLWSGIPIVEGQRFQQCGTAVCFTNGPSAGSAVDRATGRPVTPPAAPAGEADPPIFLVGRDPLELVSREPSADEGTGVLLPDLTGPAATVVVRDTGAVPTPTAAVPGAGSQACANVAGYLVCTSVDQQLTVWKVR